ncbi:MAG: BlaI/MecI/CopY family transcriptional regulator [Oscillospiraceae bacterium]
MNYSISEAEWKIMQILWKNSDITLSDIVAQLTDSQWSYSTIKTLLKRLADKNVVLVDKSVRNTFRYSPAILAQDCKMNEANSFLKKVFDGSVPTFLATFLQDKKLSQKELNELQEMISKEVLKND